jgi:hypothetical protein
VLRGCRQQPANGDANGECWGCGVKCSTRGGVEVLGGAAVRCEGEQSLDAGGAESPMLRSGIRSGVRMLRGAVLGLLLLTPCIGHCRCLQENSVCCRAHCQCDTKDWL